MKNIQLLTTIVSIILSSPIKANTSFNAPQTQFKWPNDSLAAVSLSYDDALDSQLDIAIPALDKHRFKGSFYVVINSPVLRDRRNEWLAIANNGHELGNHTINHRCSQSKPNRDWVTQANNLDTITIAQYKEEIIEANRFLTALDGKTERTLTLPCLDTIVENQDIVPHLTDLFIGIKSNANEIASSMKHFNTHRTSVIAPHNVTGGELINWVKKARINNTIVSFTFHGIGGDHLSISKQAHQELLQYLADNRKDYWVDTYLNISKYIRNAQKNKNILIVD